MTYYLSFPPHLITYYLLLITCYLLPVTYYLLLVFFFLSEKWILCLLHSDGRWRTMSGVYDCLVGKYE